MNKSIFHIRVKNFDVQAEKMLDASLRTQAIAIISSNHQNGTIVSLSREAQEEGLRQNMQVSLARKMSHRVRLLPYNSSLYSRMHHYIFKTLCSFSPIIEPTIFGQYYMDMTGMESLYKSNIQAGYCISRQINSKINLSNQIGISKNKLVSNISTAVVPELINQVKSGNESGFLAPLISGVLPVSREKPVEKMIRFLFLRQVRDIQEVTAHTQAAMILFGKHYKRIAMESQGRDNSMVKPPQLRDHIILQTILRKDTNDEDVLMATVTNLAEQLAYELRCRKQIADLVSLEVHYTDGFKKSRKSKITDNDDKTVSESCIRLFQKANYRRNRIRSIVIDAAKFRTICRQMSLFERPRNNDVSGALDKVRNRFGFSSIKTASEMLIPKIESQRSDRSKAMVKV